MIYNTQLVKVQEATLRKHVMHAEFSWGELAQEHLQWQSLVFVVLSHYELLLECQLGMIINIGFSELIFNLFQGLPGFIIVIYEYAEVSLIVLLLENFT